MENFKLIENLETERVAKGYMMAVTMSSEDAEEDSEEGDEE